MGFGVEWFPAGGGTRSADYLLRLRKNESVRMRGDRKFRQNDQIVGYETTESCYHFQLPRGAFLGLILTTGKNF